MTMYKIYSSYMYKIIHVHCITRKSKTRLLRTLKNIYNDNNRMADIFPIKNSCALLKFICSIKCECLSIS